MTFDLNNFDPSEHKGGGGGGGGEEPLPPGNWVFWIKGFKRKEGRGKSYIMFIAEPVLDFDGQPLPSDRFAPVFENTFLTQAAAWRLADLLRAVGHERPLNVNSDRELSMATLHIPFGASVKHRTWDGKTKVEFDRYIPLPAELRRRAENILEERATQEAMHGGGYGGGGGRGGGYDGGGGRGGGGGYSNNGGGYDRRQAPPSRGNEYAGGGGNYVNNDDFSDDDIPF